jgi:hypothetical protein
MFVVLTLALGAAQAHAEFYRWTDKEGREFYTNEKEKIPAEYRGSARPVDVNDERVSIGRKPDAGGARTVKVPEHKDAHGRGEEYWRKRAQKLRRQLRQQQDDHAVVLKQLEAAEEQPGSVGASAQQKKKAASAESLKKKKTQLETKIARTKRELEVDLPEEARKADAYPGWIRE